MEPPNFDEGEEFFVGAEGYEFDDLGRFKTWHPDAPNSFNHNTIIIGPAGTGKSMLLRQASWHLRKSERIYPLYVHAERWISLPLAEVLSRDATAGSKARAQLFANHDLSLAIFYRIFRVLGPDIALQAVRVFPGPPPRDVEDVGDWIYQRFGASQTCILSNQEPPDFIREAPRLRLVLDRFAEIVKSETGRSLLILLDQLDRVNPIYFDILAPALGRSNAYTLMIACRPSPSAPWQTDLHLAVGDCDRHWIGTEWLENSSWADFLVAAATDTFGEPIMEPIEEHAEYLAAIVGPSTRHFMRIVKEAQTAYKIGGTSTLAAIAKAGTWMKNHYEGELESGLSAFRSSANFLRSLQQEIAEHSSSLSDPPARIELSSATSLYLSERTQKQVRSAVREGLFIPHPPSRYGLDEVFLQYTINPLALTRSISPFQGLRPIKEAVVSIDEETFLGWDQGGELDDDSGRPNWDVIYLEPGDCGATFSAELKRILGYFSTVTESRANRHALDPRQSRSEITSASIVTVYATPFRCHAAVVTGWAISLNKPVLWLLDGTRQIPAAPFWLGTAVEADFTSKTDYSDIATSIAAIMSSAGRGNNQPWQASPDGQPLMTAPRDLTGKLTIIGQGDSGRAVHAEANRNLSLNNLPAAQYLDLGDCRTQDDFYSLLRAARTSPVFLVSACGDAEEDLLAFCLLGVHTAKDNDFRQKMNRKRTAVKRRLFLVRPQPYAREVDFLGSLPDSVISADVAAVVEEAVLEFERLKSRL